jgi:hypothetical protein
MTDDKLSNRKWTRSVIRVEPIHTDIIRYTSPGCDWKIERATWQRHGWIISEVGQPILSYATDGWLMAEWSMKMARLTMCQTLAEARRNVEKLERLYAKAEAERQDCLRMLGG